MSFFDSVIDKFHKSLFWGRIFHTLNYCLQKELSDCETILDIGCGPSSPLQYCSNIKYSVGVEPFKPYLEESKKKKIHTKYLNKKIEELDFPANSFDAVIMIEVLEHLPKKVGREILKKAEKWARKKVIISTPNGFLPGEDSNPFQSHRSGWKIEEVWNYGYIAYGLAGWKFLRKKNAPENINREEFFTIRFRPKPFWVIISALSQIVTYYFPKLAFEIFYVKNLIESNETE